MELVSQQGILGKINLILENIELIRNIKFQRDNLPEILRNIELIEYKTTYEMPNGEKMSDSNKRYEVYKIPFLNTYLKFFIESDSYGDNERIISMKFVAPKTKEITIYE